MTMEQSRDIIDINQLPAKIKEIRKRKNISQKQMAKYLGFTQGSYGRIETGKTAITVDKLKKISDILGLSFSIETGNEDILIKLKTTKGYNETINRMESDLMRSLSTIQAIKVYHQGQKNH